MREGAESMAPFFDVMGCHDYLFINDYSCYSAYGFPMIPAGLWAVS